MSDKITKFLKSLDKKFRAKLKKRIQLLLLDPYNQENPLDVKKLKGMQNVFRLRIGKVRIIYEIKNKKVHILDIDYRENLY